MRNFIIVSEFHNNNFKVAINIKKIHRIEPEKEKCVIFYAKGEKYIYFGKLEDIVDKINFI